MTEAIYTTATLHPTLSAHSQVTRAKFYRFLMTQNAPAKAGSCKLCSAKQLLRGVSRAGTRHRMGRAPQCSRSPASLQHTEPNHCSTDQQFGPAPARERLPTGLPALSEILQPQVQQPCIGLAFCCKQIS